MKRLTRETIHIYWRHLLRYKWAAIVITALSVASSIFNTIAPLYIKELLDAATTGKPKAVLYGILAAFMFYTVARMITRRAMFFILAYVDSSVMRDLSNTCFAYLHKHSTAFFANSFVGSLVKKVNRFYRGYETLYNHVVMDFIPITIEILAMMVVLAFRSPWLSAIIGVWIFLYVLITYLFNRYKLKYDVEKSEQDTKVTGVLADTITNHENVKLFVGYKREVARLGKENDRLQKMRRFTWQLGDAFETMQIFTMMALEFGMYYVAIGLYTDGIITIGDFGLIQAYLVHVFSRLWSLGHTMRNIYEGMAEAEEMTEILLTPNEIQDHPRAKKLKVTKGAIAFDKVSFDYNKTRTVVPNLNLEIPGGQKVALVGASGAGKSTLVKLLLRKHDATRGKILIDGQRIDKVTLETLWQNIGMVPQEPILFHRTLMENIRYGKPDATDEEVIEAAKLAHAHEFISNFPDQYNTYVGERGVKLSGGERQRVAIARAILKNAPILLLDEATSALDSESETYIQDALATLMKGKTVLVIAHRLSTIMKMDRIIVLDGGEVIEEGTHAQLLKRNKGTYKKLWNLQVGSFGV